MSRSVYAQGCRAGMRRGWEGLRGRQLCGAPPHAPPGPAALDRQGLILRGEHIVDLFCCSLGNGILHLFKIGDASQCAGSRLLVQALLHQELIKILSSLPWFSFLCHRNPFMRCSAKANSRCGVF